MSKRIFLSSPHMSKEGFEKEFISKAFDTNWIAPLGENVDKFEDDVESFLNVKKAVAVSSGTAAIHMALKACGVKEKDIVFCQDLTFIASVNPVMYEKAIPVFIDSEYESFNMSPKALEKAFKKYPNVKAVIVVHLYGVPANLDEIMKICNKHNAKLIEDSCESLGSLYKERYTGTFGDFGTFSFNGNKIITTSGGGMVVSNNEEKIDKIKFWITQSKEKVSYYEHKEIGYNYRMSNILAGIGRGQMKVLNDRIEKKRKIYDLYKTLFENKKEITMQKIPKNTNPNNWLSVMYLGENVKIQPRDIINRLDENNIEARHIWKPMHLQPVFRDCDFITLEDGKSISEDIYNRGVCLPSDTKMTEEEEIKVANIIKEVL